MNRAIYRPLAIGLIVVMLFGMIPFMTAPKAEATPTLSNLQNAILNGYKALQKLYKGDSYLGSDYSADSENWGAPIKIQQQSPYEWVLAGELTHFTGITVNSIGATTEDFDYVFSFQGIANNPVIGVVINYAYSSSQISVTVKCKSVPSSYTYRVGLYDLWITFGGNIYCTTATQGMSGTVYMDAYNPTSLRTFRYTIRHGSMVGYKDARIQGNENDQEWNLNHLASNLGFAVDFYDPLYHYDWNKDGIYAAEAYFHDCATYGSMPTGYDNGLSFYPYYSKVCIIGWPAYVALIQYDPLGYAAKALDNLALYHNPDTVISTSYPYTIRDHARYIEANWWWSGVGVRGQSMFGQPWPTSYVSSVRSAYFLALESIIGYKYGDTTSQSYADQMADILVNFQGSGGVRIPSSGVVLREESPTSITRKQFAYTWPVAWNSLKAVAPKAILTQIGDMIQEGTYLRREYDGVAVTNAETVDTITRALMDYLEFKYPTGVYIVQPRATFFAETEFWNTGSTRYDRTNYFSTTASRTIYVWSRNFNDGYSRYVRLFIDGVQKAEWVCGGGYTTCYNSWTGSISAGNRNIGIVTTTYDTVTPDVWWVQTVFTTSGGTLAADQVQLPVGAHVLTMQEQADLIAQNATLPVIVAPD
jgi:hypothetical protein